MFDFHEKRKIRTIVYSKIFIIFVFLVGVMIARSAYERFIVERAMAEKRDAKVSELNELELRLHSLEAEIARLKNNRGIEEELRSRFDAVREGEEIVVILEDTAVAATQAAVPEPAQEEPKPHSWWSFLNVFNIWTTKE